jgi:hypothetical protein
MKGQARYLFSLIVAAAAFPHLGSAAESGSAVELGYALPSGATNVYNLLVEVQGENGREALTGNFIVSSRLLRSNLTALSVRGQLRPKPMPGGPPMAPFYRPGGVMPLSGYMSGPPIEGRELVIDAHGHIVRAASELALPIPLGQLMASLFQEFPAQATSSWEDEHEVFVLDEPLLQGPGTGFFNQSGSPVYVGYYPGRPPIGALAVLQRTRLEVTAATGETVTLRKSLTLESRMPTGAEPRVSATGSGQIIVERMTGWPRQVELDCKTVVVTESLSRRSMLKLKWQLLEGAEREAALVPPRPPEENKLKPEDIAKLGEQLTSDDQFTRQNAARTLESRGSKSATPELLASMSKLATDRDDVVRHAALTILAAQGTKEDVPLLLKALKEPIEPDLRITIAKGLGRLQDPRAAEPLADLLATGQTEPFFSSGVRENQVTDALIQLGPAAEPAVLALLKEKNIETRCQACAALKRIGTRKSLAPLKELTTYPSKNLSEAAADACRSIQARVDK